MSDSIDSWEFRPQKGVGHLLLGATRAEVDALSDVYGAAESRTQDRIPDSILQDTLREGDLTDEERAEILALYSELGPTESSTTEVRRSGGLVLRYEADKLVEILVSPQNAPFRFGRDRTIGSAPALEVARAIEALVGQAGFFEGTTAWFPAVGIIMEGFLTLRDDALVPLDGDEEFDERSFLILPSVTPPDTARALPVPPGNRTE